MGLHRMKVENRHNDILKGYTMLLYFAGSMITYEPSEECIADFWKNGIVRNLPVKSTNPNFIRAAAQLRDSTEKREFLGKKLRDDFLRLFSGAGEELAPPFESAFSEAGYSVDSQSNESVSEFYNAYGWKPGLRARLHDDHLGVELLFLNKMIEQYLQLDDNACQSAMRSEIHRYIRKHLMSWIPDWNNSIQKSSETAGYKGIGSLIVACSEDLSSMFEEGEDTIISDKLIRN